MCRFSGGWWALFTGGGGQLTRIVATIYDHWIQRSMPMKSATKLECQARIAIKGGCCDGGAFHGGIRVARSSASSPNKTGNDVWHRVRRRRMKSTRLDIREACSAWTGWVTTNQIWSRGRCIDNWILVIGRNSEPPSPSFSIRLCVAFIFVRARYGCLFCVGLQWSLHWSARCLKHTQWEAPFRVIHGEVIIVLW